MKTDHYALRLTSALFQQIKLGLGRLRVGFLHGFAS